MRKIRSCTNAQLNTGISKCPPEFGKMKGAILVEPGTKLPEDLTGDKLEELCHADRPDRVYGIITFTEYAKNGGEVQTSANGYGGEEVTGISARKDTYTLNKFYPELHASLTKNATKAWEVYFFDEDNVLYGINDGTDMLAGFPMSCVYSDATPHPTSSAKATMTVTFAHADAKLSIMDFDYIQLDFKPQRLVLGLTLVSLVKVTTGENDYKIIENMGGNDVTAVYASLISAGVSTVLTGNPTAATYNEDANTITITSTGDTGIRLKSPKELYENGIKGIEQL
jgi:hypothetical protein|nr:MAG TPA: hypothetical protein [Caudoviricetes sp.]